MKFNRNLFFAGLVAFGFFFVLGGVLPIQKPLASATAARSPSVKATSVPMEAPHASSEWAA